MNRWAVFIRPLRGPGQTPRFILLLFAGASDTVLPSPNSANMVAAHGLQLTCDRLRMCSSYWRPLLVASRQRL